MKASDKPNNLYIVCVYAQIRSSCTISIYPNPCSNPLALHVFKRNNETVTYKLLNSLSEMSTISSVDEVTELIDLENHNSSCDSFTLLVYVDGVLIKTFLINKIRNMDHVNHPDNGIKKSVRSSRKLIVGNAKK